MHPQVYIENSHGPITLTPKSVAVQTTIIGKLVMRLSMEGATMKPQARLGIAPDIQDKIIHNNICSESWLIYRYTEYGRAIEVAYQELNKNINNGKNKALRKIHDLYKEELALNQIQLVNPEMDKIRNIADVIIKNIYRKLLCFVNENDSSLKDVFMEDLEFGINLIVGHAFVECVILEAPV